MNFKDKRKKGQQLQKKIVREMLDLCPTLTTADVKSCPDFMNGSDIILSEKASKYFPLSLECKNHERSHTIYSHYQQACGHYPNKEPCFIMKKDNRKPLAVVDAKWLLKKLVEIQTLMEKINKNKPDTKIKYNGKGNLVSIPRQAIMETAVTLA